MTLLETHGLKVFYGDFQALFGIDLHVARGETVAIIGANGAGKTSFFRAVTGLIGAAPNMIVLDGQPIGGFPPSGIVRRGVAMVPEGRRVFPSLSVEENLLVGAWTKPRTASRFLEKIYSLFPVLKERRNSPGTALSGGQQQMVAIGRALASEPRLLLCDEISLGLAPAVIAEVYAALPKVKAVGTSLVIVEQDIVRALSVADRVYCFQEGRLTLEGRPESLTRDMIHGAYFGTSRR